MAHPDTIAHGPDIRPPPRPHPESVRFGIVQHRRDIEGLRALAVVMVVLYHAGVPGTSGGFIGVDVFFVISGFLITGLLLAEHEANGRIRLGAFYARRARRLLPISTVVLVATALTGLLVLPPPALRSLGTDVLAAAGFATNLVLAERGADYLAGDTDPSAVQHFWSLAVEEQFYLIWPGSIVVLAAGTRRIRRRLAPVLAGVIGVSLTLSIVLTDRTPTWAYFGLHTRAFELAVGAALAVGWRRVDRLPTAMRAASGWAGLVVLVVATSTMGRVDAFPGWVALAPVLATAAVISCGDGNRLGPGRLFDGRIVQWAGSRSYSSYLWHWPALVLLPHVIGRDPNAIDTFAAVVLALALAELGYRLVENPARRSVRLAARPAATWSMALGLLGVTAAAGVAVGWYRPEIRTGVVASAPEPQFAAAAPAGTTPSTRPGEQSSGALPTSRPAITTVTPTTVTPTTVTPTTVTPTTGPALIDTRLDAPLAAIVDALDPAILPDNVRPSVYEAVGDTNVLYTNGCHQYLSATVADGCVFGDPEGAVTVGLVGDSHAAQWFSALHEIAERRGWRLVVHTQGGCPVLDVVPWNNGADSRFVHCAAWLDESLRAFEEDGVSVALLSQYWGLIDADTRRPIDASLWTRELPTFFDRLRAAGIEPILLLDTPDPPDPVPSCAAARPDDLRRCEPGPLRTSEGLVRDAAIAAAEDAGVGIVDPRAWLCAPDPGSGSVRCPVTVGDILVYRDSHHLTDTMTRWLAPVLDRAIGDWISARGTANG